jgi:hypothetical protein
MHGKRMTIRFQVDEIPGALRRRTAAAVPLHHAISPNCAVALHLALQRRGVLRGCCPAAVLRHAAALPMCSGARRPPARMLGCNQPGNCLCSHVKLHDAVTSASCSPPAPTSSPGACFAHQADQAVRPLGHSRRSSSPASPLPQAPTCGTATTAPTAWMGWWGRSLCGRGGRPWCRWRWMASAPSSSSTGGTRVSARTAGSSIPTRFCLPSLGVLLQSSTVVYVCVCVCVVLRRIPSLARCQVEDFGDGCLLLAPLLPAGFGCPGCGMQHCADQTLRPAALRAAEGSALGMSLNQPFDAALKNKEAGGWNWVNNPQASPEAACLAAGSAAGLKLRPSCASTSCPSLGSALLLPVNAAIFASRHSSLLTPHRGVPRPPQLCCRRS